MSDFCPGPWIARGTSVFTNHGGRRRPVKVCDTRQPLFTDECQRGTAALIAEAPAMVEALRDLARADDADLPTLELQRGAIAARAILARIEGSN